MNLVKTPEERLIDEIQEWNRLSCSKDPIPKTFSDIGTWINTVGGCLKASPSSMDKIGPDRYTNGYVLREYFGPLRGGQLMDALGSNNDCLIHSFLICTYPVFRTYDESIRSKMARYFRRFVVAKLPNMTEDSQNRLNSFRFLTTDELELMSMYFNVPFIIVSGAVHPVDRLFDIHPNDQSPFWKDKEESADIIYYVIHGSGIHFTPVAFNQPNRDKYNFVGQTHSVLKGIRSKLAKEREADMAVDQQRIRKTMELLHRFMNETSEIQQIKQQIDAQTTPGGKTEIINKHAVHLSNLIRQRIDQLDSMNYRKDYGYQHIMNLIQSLSGGANNATSVKEEQMTQTKFVPEDMELAAAIEASKKAFEEEEAKRIGQTPDPEIQERADIEKAVLESLETASVNTQRKPQISNTKLSANNVLRRMSNITATISGNATQYEVTVYKASNSVNTPSIVVKGGKRKTHKKANKKNRKTKRHIKK